VTAVMTTLADSTAELIRLPSTRAAPGQRVVAVEFRSRDGRSCTAIGGGATLLEAIDWARGCCPDAPAWEAVGWNDLYGE
jgi:xanthine/CO dehydrogenase XdhC/CoxF family maturation factor